MLCNFTEQGIRNVKETTNRAEAVRRLAREFNVSVKEIYWTLGEYDVQKRGQLLFPPWRKKEADPGFPPAGDK